MSNSSDNSIIPNSVIDLLVSDIFRKNGISLDKAKGNLSEEQKQMLKDLIKDLSQQVDSFVKNPSNEKKIDE
ncbi:spore coat protein [Bacillus sp. ISL-18]|uniref:spore coat protein n=1 Tax=Bacillaceae TaxID=186817 RepID=UPI001BE72A67|nr:MULTISPECIES: spore coat protein [Bacillaceae]MBT2658305.1 spore coat protein [Bacillus sp. ISL-18]ULT59049.1 spore coat protein [Neobacillus drentensis]